jgi:hypothetical protein
MERKAKFSRRGKVDYVNWGNYSPSDLLYTIQFRDLRTTKLHEFSCIKKSRDTLFCLSDTTSYDLAIWAYISPVGLMTSKHQFQMAHNPNTLAFMEVNYGGL